MLSKDLHNNSPPLHTWEITLTLEKGEEPRYLYQAYRIITSFLALHQIQHVRVTKGTHCFKLASVGESVDRLIERTLLSETWPHITTNRGGPHVDV